MLCVQSPISPITTLSPLSPHFSARFRPSTPRSPRPSLATLPILSTTAAAAAAAAPSSPSSVLGKRPRSRPTTPHHPPRLTINGPSPIKRSRSTQAEPIDVDLPTVGVDSSRAIASESLAAPSTTPALHLSKARLRGRGLLRLNIPLTATMTHASSSPSPGGSHMLSISTTPNESTLTPGLVQSMQGVHLSPRKESAFATTTTTTTTTTPFPPVLSLKRSNPKGLSLSLAASFHNTASSDSTPTPSVTCSTAVSPNPMGGGETPMTPGPPRTPALKTSSLGRATMKTGRRPSLLSLITTNAPPLALNDPAALVPPTPSIASYPYGSLRSRGHTRMRSAGAQLAAYAHQTEIDPRVSQSAYPGPRGSFAVIDERSCSTTAHAATAAAAAAAAAAAVSTSPSSSMPGMSPSTSNSSNSATDSASSTPSTSPPLQISSEERELTYPSLLALEPYSDGPIEIIPGVWLGAEDSVWHWDSWARGKSSVAIANVAQEIENPFDPNTSVDTWDWPSNARGKPKIALSAHENEGQPRVEYAHLRWSHGEGGLADLPDSATLDELVNSPTYTGADRDQNWRFWEAIRWLEIRRRAGMPVLIHCQCGVSRSATLIVAYVMTLAAAGVAPQRIGHLKTMQDAYDYVKGKSPWIGPNVSLVFQLVEYARNLSTLLSAHVNGGGKKWATQWPTLVDIESEDAWAARRREFGDDSEGTDAEARALDEAMVARLHARE
ncbi:hypothetical protein CC85DRAFT_300744 [Cutaneotrichosporon oleaginosum]|uniref:protein-tyrosine-phosphatase n=1 Tax=Cutaneotrichosporon oleaginosum TaxID=879819 RepID=A0A0J0XSJ2_9TREE|nr:uncharacterized protein CC85DRAFT_300744 [Cutaneotrichosporon oleaginosum]KLT44061.1 hypothetical protein CC85DRAFT_300744 [Cutaneotrichosporon oleaginosum]TXT09482.1 hypothetical protein COLE_03416 [Cutaneotrichosporon oleaginosum]